MDNVWRERLEQAFMDREPNSGLPLYPLPLNENEAKTERVSTYVELPLLRFYERYQARGGFKSVSEVVRRLSIIGAIAEGYNLEGEDANIPN